MKVKTNRLGRRWTKYYKKVNRAPRTGALHPLVLRGLIQGDYAIFLNSIIASNSPSITHPTFSDSNLISLEPDIAVRLSKKMAQTAINHSSLDDSEKLEIFEIIRFTTVSAIRAIKAIEAEQGKNSGSANRRRSIAIKQFKQAKSDYSLLLTASRGALSSTIKYRRTLQDTTDDEVKYTYSKKNGINSYISQVWIDDYTAITKVLNSDIEFCFRAYKAVKNATPVFNRLLSKYNSLIQHKPSEK